MKNWKAKTIIAGTILLLIVASVYYYIALPAINIHSLGFWKFIIVDACCRNDYISAVSDSFLRRVRGAGIFRQTDLV